MALYQPFAERTVVKPAADNKHFLWVNMALPAKRGSSARAGIASIWCIPLSPGPN